MSTYHYFDYEENCRLWSEKRAESFEKKCDQLISPQFAGTSVKEKIILCIARAIECKELELDEFWFGINAGEAVCFLDQYENYRDEVEELYDEYCSDSD